ncbi:MAG: bacteriocin-protection protein [Balneolaceae bacterium]|nr:bacteriocin-protection protein [Balneolaceae bacterium]
MNEKPLFFESPSDFRDWLEENHNTKEVQWVGYYKVVTGKPSMRWEGSVREALCYGWIDGLRKSIDEERYKIRFTPRRAGSHWSAKNIQMVEELTEEGRMKEAGIEAFGKRSAKNSRKASYESKVKELSEEFQEQLKANARAWEYFENDLAPGYKRRSIYWVMSAKREDTRNRRFKVLLESCEESKKIPMLRR